MMEASMEAVIAVLLAISVGGSAFAFIHLKGSDPFFRPLVPGVVVTSLGLLAAIAMYVWLFDQSSCQASSFACMVNANQGLLTGLGLLIAAAAIWTGAISNAAARRRTEDEAIARTASIVAAAIEELNHNLVHVACAYHENALTELPQVTIDASRILLDPANRERLAPDVIEHLEPLQRNKDLLDEFRSRLHADPSLEVTSADPEPLGGLVRCMFGTIFALWVNHPNWSYKAVDQPELQDLPKIVEQPAAFFSYRSSGMQEDAPALRTNQTALICWIDDQPIEGVRTFQLMSRYRDAAIAHQPHP
jgi:hypothetical protein